MYYYRNLTPEQWNEVVAYRRQRRRPWHSPPHWNFEGERQFFICGEDLARIPDSGLREEMGLNLLLKNRCAKSSATIVIGLSSVLTGNITNHHKERATC